MCTAILFDNGWEMLLAQNYDFYYGHGLVIGNPAGLMKTALGEDERKAARWVSQYASLTFNQFARELPVCGINSMGLAIASTWHDGCTPATPNGDRHINELQWIQYQLDCFATASQVIDHLTELELQVALSPMHYLVADASGKSAVIEHDGNRLLPLRSEDGYACCNAPFRVSLDYLKRCESRVSDEVRIVHPVLDRAAKALLIAREFGHRASFDGNAVEHAFDGLQAVRRQPAMGYLFRWISRQVPPSQTVWQIVLDVPRGVVWFRTPQHPELKHIRLEDMLGDVAEEAHVLRLDVQEAGDVSHRLVPYTRAAHAEIVRKSFQPIQDRFPEAEQQALIEYPELFEVIEGRRPRSFRL